MYGGGHAAIFSTFTASPGPDITEGGPGSMGLWSHPQETSQSEWVGEGKNVLSGQPAREEVGVLGQTRYLHAGSLTGYILPKVVLSPQM